jgi:hypothetical protein
MHAFVINAERLGLLNNLKSPYPRPIALQWINRGTDQMLNRTTIDLIMRTLYQPVDFSESVRRLHRTAGLRVIFASAADRAKFAAIFEKAAGSG